MSRAVNFSFLRGGQVMHGVDHFPLGVLEAFLHCVLDHSHLYVPLAYPCNTLITISLWYKIIVRTITLLHTHSAWQVFPESIETGDLCKSEENPGHAHPPLFPPPNHTSYLISNSPLPFVTQCDDFKGPTGPVRLSVSILEASVAYYGYSTTYMHAYIFQVLVLSESVASDCTGLIRIRSSGGMLLYFCWSKAYLTSYNYN